MLIFWKIIRVFAYILFVLAISISIYALVKEFNTINDLKSFSYYLGFFTSMLGLYTPSILLLWLSSYKIAKVLPKQEK
jgi:hypothetical protein